MDKYQIDILKVNKDKNGLTHVYMRTDKSFTVSSVRHNDDKQKLYQLAYVNAYDLINSNNIESMGETEANLIKAMEPIDVFTPDESKPSSIEIIPTEGLVVFDEDNTETEVGVTIIVKDQYGNRMSNDKVQTSKNIKNGKVLVTDKDGDGVKIEAKIGELEAFSHILIDKITHTDINPLNNSEFMDYLLDLDLRLASIEAENKEKDDV